MSESRDNVLRLNPRDPGADRRMMMTPDLWPFCPLLPVKRSRGAHPPERGVMVATANAPRTRVFTVVMYDRRIVDVARGARPEHDDIPHFDYESIDAILGAGWRVN